jgi:hypothetical protein
MFMKNNKKLFGFSLFNFEETCYTANNFIWLTHSYNCGNMARESLPVDRKSTDYEWQCQSG